MRGKFISPAVTTRQIDLTFVPEAISRIGAGVIGLAQKGKAFVPTSIQSFGQYRRGFGGTGRNYFMSYAAKQYLANQGQLTVVRLLGQQADGVQIDDGYRVLQGSTSADWTLRAVIRKTSNSVTGLAAQAVSGEVIITTSFSGSTLASRSASVSFLPSASNYIGRVFPTSRSDVRTTGGDPVFVGVTYGLYADAIVKNVSFSAGRASAVAITSQVVGNKYCSAISPVVVSQGYGSAGAATVYDLFKIMHLGQGRGTNADVKIEVSNIVFDDQRQFPDFYVNVRQFNDTDQTPIYLESFRVNLDITAQNYILKVIGDRTQKLVTDQSQTPFVRTFGDWDNKSEYIRIAHPDSTDQAFVSGLPTVPSNARPQGFRGVPLAAAVVQSGSLVPTIEYVETQQKRTNPTDASPTGQVSKKITLGWDFVRMDSSFLDPQMYYGTSAQTMSSYTTLGFYMKPTSTDRTPSTASFDIADLTARGSDVSATIIAGGNTNNIRFAFPLYAGLDGWDLDTDDTPQNQVMGGLHAEAVNDAIDLFANADDIDVNMLAIPGLGSGVNGVQINRAVELCDTRGDCFFVADLCKRGTYTTSTSAVVDDAINSKISEVKDQADGYDSSYVAAFFPWVRVKDSDTNELVWIPPSVAAYAAIGYNDKVAHPWFAAAGFKRGTLDFVVEARMKLTKDMRDDLYDHGVNPIATIKDQILVFGNKTLQKKTTDLQSLDIRRGLIDLKKLVASVAQYVLFDKNVIRTRDELIGRITPILETMQSEQGISAFKIVSNPTTDEIDRKQLPVTIYVQFTKTAEFIPIDFVVTPTGVTF